MDTIRRVRPLLRALVLTALSVGLLTRPSPALASSCSGAGSDAYSSAVLGDGPVAYYRLDETAGPTMCDSSASSNNGTYNASGVSYGVPGALPASTDTAVAADGTNGVVGTSGSNSPVTGNHSLSLEGWFKKTTTAQSQALIAIGTAGTGSIAGLAVWHSPNSYSNNTKHCLDHGSSLVLDLYDGGAECWDTTAQSINVYDGQWHHLVVTYDASSKTVTGYVDGHSLGGQPATATVNLQASGVRVGNWVDTNVNQPFVGDLDEVAVYPGVLSAQQVGAHYAAASTQSANPNNPNNPNNPAHKHPTTTQLFCTYVVVLSSDGCAVNVLASDGSASTPTGAVSFSAGPPCPLVSVPSAPGLASCQTAFYVPQGNVPAVTAHYAGDASHEASSASTLDRSSNATGNTTDSVSRAAPGQFPNEIDVSTQIPVDGSVVGACAVGSGATAASADAVGTAAQSGLSELGTVTAEITQGLALERQLLGQIGQNVPGGGALTPSSATQLDNSFEQPLADAANALAQLNALAGQPAGQTPQAQAQLAADRQALQQLNAGLNQISQTMQQSACATGQLLNNARAHAASAGATAAANKKKKHRTSARLRILGRVTVHANAGALKLRLKLSRSALKKAAGKHNRLRVSVRVVMVLPSATLSHGVPRLVVKDVVLKRRPERHSKRHG